MPLLSKYYFHGNKGKDKKGRKGIREAWARLGKPGMWRRLCCWWPVSLGLAPCTVTLSFSERGANKDDFQHKGMKGIFRHVHIFPFLGVYGQKPKFKVGDRNGGRFTHLTGTSFKQTLITLKLFSVYIVHESLHDSCHPVSSDQLLVPVSNSCPAFKSSSPTTQLEDTAIQRKDDPWWAIRWK